MFSRYHASADAEGHLGSRLPKQLLWREYRNETAKRMTGAQSRLLNVGSRVYWRDDKNDQGTVIETNWAGITLKWDNRDQQVVLHNDMESVGILP